MRKILLALVASFLVSPAFADFTAKDASAGTITFKNPNTCSSVVCTPIFAQYDSTGTNAVAVLTAGADAASNTATGALSYSRNLVFNGTTWDRWTGAVTNAGTFAVQAAQSGTWNITNISGTVSLPTGAATSANQTNGTQTTRVTDGTNTAAVKAGSTAPVATDPAVVTTKSPNSPDVPFAAYSTASITRSANTTTYTSNTGWNNGTATFFSFTAACRVNGGQVLIPRVDIWSSANPTMKLTGVLYLFSAVPGANVSDNATFTIASADFANLTGSFGGFPFSLGNNQASGASNSSASLTGTTYQAQCASGSTTITGMVEVTNAYVPASGEVLHIGLATVGAN